MSKLYTASVTASGGRNGMVKSSDGLLELDVRMPKELQGPGGATNPEQLFAAGYAACFDSALNLVIRMKRLKEVQETQVTAHVSLDKNVDQGFDLSVVLEVSIVGVSQQQAEELVSAAHQVCPYSRATRGNIEVELHVVVK